MNKLALAAVVVAYYPPSCFTERLRCYAGFLNHVVVVDNTEGALPLSFGEIANVTHLRLGTNGGVGHALNVGLQHAQTLGFDSVILLDQDSDLNWAAAALASSARRKDIGIVSLTHVLRGLPAKPARGEQEACREIRVAMTSGSILNMEAYRTCGDFDAKLFVDFVDHDYCLRLRRAGYRIVQCAAASFDHQLGDPRTIRILGISATFVTHRPFRAYYMMRNGLYVATKHFASDPITALGVLRLLLKELLKAVTVEDHKVQRLRYIGLGLRHWVLSRYGKLVVHER